MVAIKQGTRECHTENQPQRTLLLFGLSPAHGPSSGGGRVPSGAFLHCDPDRLLLPVMTEHMITSDDLASFEVSSAARDSLLQ